MTMSYVIMLEKELSAHEDDWPISAEKSTLDAIRAVTQHSGNPTLVARSGRTMKSIEPKSLTDTETGTVDAGAIYRSTKK